MLATSTYRRKNATLRARSSRLAAPMLIGYMTCSGVTQLMPRSYSRSVLLSASAPARPSSSTWKCGVAPQSSIVRTPMRFTDSRKYLSEWYM
ncbi:MAG: hypothetical protein BWY81_00723 [Firmicutes bacterium ADurb.Bin467]|nr:MAG: hypothetical protein BWY81_00723 [Firmicutes bacterium ADurb.Bin467]